MEVRQVFILGVLVAGLAGGVVSAADLPRVKTPAGTVQGSLTADGKVTAFKGIPYAAPPVGNLRWQAPQPAAKWKGVRDATAFGSHCVQSGSYPDMVFHDPGPSEDCLTLNVWAPAGAKPGSLPVMVWIYGGGFQTGGTSENRQDGQFLAQRGVVVVSMNYRLGIFGFFVHPELAAESSHHAAGNYGLLDQAAALGWVKGNIREFGGDHGKVTIFGESAGSSSVSAQMASPVSRGLFAGAIGESGSVFPGARPGYGPRAAREERDSQFMQKAFGTAKLADLRKLSTEDVVNAATAKGGMARKVGTALNFGADVDGYFFPEAPAAIYAAGKQAHVPLLAGWNADEGRGEVIDASAKPTAASFAAQAATEFGPDAPKFLAVYAGTTDAEAQTSAGDYAGDKFIAYSTWKWLEAQAKTGGAPVYRYFFELGSPGDDNHPARLGAFHSDDIEYVFGTLDSRPGVTVRAEDRALSGQMQAYWTNFAKTGDPNGAGLPAWGKYGQADGWTVMHLNARSVASADAHRERYLFLEDAWGKSGK